MRSLKTAIYKFALFVIALVACIVLLQMDIIEWYIALLIGVPLALLYWLDPYGGSLAKFIIGKDHKSKLINKLNEMGYFFSHENKGNDIYLNKGNSFWNDKIIPIQEIDGKLQVSVAVRSRERKELERLAEDYKGVSV